MTAPVIPALGSTTVNRKWILEVNTGTVGTPIWSPLEGITSITPAFDNANLAEDTDQQGAGAESQVKTAYSWSVTGTCRDAGIGSSPSTEPIAQAFVRAHAEAVVGPANSIYIRCYEYDVNDPTALYSPRTKAYYGKVATQWVQAGGDMKALAMWNFTFTGQGLLSKISTPVPVTPAVPTITSVSPNTGVPASSVGKQLRVVGTGFQTTVPNGVLFDASTPATSYDIESDTLMIVSTPSLAAGVHTIKVTNAVGTSATSNVTFA